MKAIYVVFIFSTFCFANSLVKMGDSTIVPCRITVEKEDNATSAGHKWCANYSLQESLVLRLSQTYQSVALGDSLYGATHMNFTWQSLGQEYETLDFVLRGGFTFEDNLMEPINLGLTYVMRYTFENALSLSSAFQGDIGLEDPADQGVMLRTRFALSCPLWDTYTGSIQLYNGYNRKGAFCSLKDQNHRAGLMLKKSFDQISLKSSIICGLTPASTDTNINLSIGYVF